MLATHHIVPRNRCKAAKLLWAELILPAAGAACRPRRRPCGHRRLSWRWLFPIIGCKKRPRTLQASGMRANRNTGNAVAESENIVAETAEKIFADLADAQTINHDKNGSWKTPL